MALISKKTTDCLYSRALYGQMFVKQRLLWLEARWVQKFIFVFVTLVKHILDFIYQYLSLS